MSEKITASTTHGESFAVTQTPAPIQVVRDLLARRALTMGLVADDDGEAAVDDAIERLLDLEVKTPEATDEECSRFYATHSDRFTSGELVFVHHILFAVTAGAPLDAIRAKAEETLRHLHDVPGAFADYAARYSNCPSGQQGGNLGQLSRGECAPEFEEAVFKGNALGLLPELVRTRFGFHIVAVEGRIAGTLIPYEAVRGQIADFLREGVQRKALEQYVRLLAAELGAVIPGLTAPTSPLLQ